MNSFTSLFIALVAFSGVLFTGCQPAQENSSPEWAELPVSSENAEALKDYYAGLEVSDIGLAADAYEYFSSAVEKDPSFVSAQVYKAWFSPSAKEFGDNVRILNTLTEGANETEAQLIKMTSAFASGDYDQQYEAAKAIVELNPDVARAHVIMGTTFDGNNQYADGRTHYQKAIELAPLWTGGHAQLMNSYMFNDPRDFAKAEESGLKMVEIAPDNARAHTNLGDCYRAQKDLNKALGSYQQASRVDPEDNVAYLKVGHVQSLLGQYDEARESYAQGAEFSPNPMGAMGFSAFTYLYAGDYEGAVSALEDDAANLAAKGVPSNSLTDAKMTCTFFGAMMAFHHGDTEYFAECIARRKPLSVEQAQNVGTPEARAYFDAEMAYWEGLLLAMNNDYDGTLAKAEENMAILEKINDPTKLQNYNFLLGYLGMQNEDYDNAIAHFEQTNQTNMYNKYWLARANEAAGNSDEAIKLYSEIADYNFNNIGYALVRNEVREKIPSS